MRSAFATTAVVLLLSPPLASTVSAQSSWLPPQGQGSVAVSFQGLDSPTHLDRHGDELPRGRVTSGTMLFGVDYGLTHLLSIDAKVALVAARHTGADSGHGPLDTGIYHGSLQDARFAVALQVPTDSSLAIAPYAGVILPTRDYETGGHSAPGRHLRTVQIGTWIGRDLDPWLPNAHVQGHYAFSFVERVEGMSINRSNVDLEAGYSVGRRITATVASSLQLTHGGVYVPLPRDEHYDTVLPFHDRVTRDNRLLMSAGATVSLGRATLAYASVVWTVWGRNTHAIRGIIAGTTWTFGRRLPFGEADSTAAEEVATAVRSLLTRPAAESGR